MLGYLQSHSTDNWRDTFTPLVDGLVTDAGEQWAAQMGIAFNVQNVQALLFQEDYVLRFAQEINDTTKADITAILEQGQFEGWSIDTLKNRLGDTFRQYMKGDLSADDFAWFNNRMPGHRLEMIARTETIRAYGAGTQAIFEDWGVEQKQWWTANDERTCLFCMEMHGKVIATESNFASLGDVLVVTDSEGAPHTMTLGYSDTAYPPLHVDCRCTVLPVTEQDLTQSDVNIDDADWGRKPLKEYEAHFAHWNDFWESQSQEVRDAFFEYSTKDYQDINSYLRGTALSQGRTAEVEAIIDRMTSVMGNMYLGDVGQTVGERVNLYRGMDAKYILPSGLTDPSALIGTILQDDAFMSASAAESIGLSFAATNSLEQDSVPALFRIEAEASTPGVNMQAVSRSSSEFEWLLSSGGLEITDVQRRESGDFIEGFYWEITAKWVKPF